MEKHRTVAGALQIVQGAIILLVALLIFAGFFGGSRLADDPQVGAILSGVGTGVAIFLAILSLPFILAGFGFVSGKSWARPLMWVMAILGLVVNVPIGTAIGVYTIWVLMKTG